MVTSLLAKADFEKLPSLRKRAQHHAYAGCCAGPCTEGAIENASPSSGIVTRPGNLASGRFEDNFFEQPSYVRFPDRYVHGRGEGEGPT